MNCTQFKKNVDAYLDSEASQGVCGDIESHAVSCGSCRQHVEAMRKVSGLLIRMPAPPPVPGGFAERVLARARSQRTAECPRKTYFPLPSIRWWMDLTLPGRAVAGAAVLIGLAIGTFMGVDITRAGQTADALPEKAADLIASYELDVLADTPRGSLAHVVLTLDQ